MWVGWENRTQRWMQARATTLLKRHSEDSGIRSSMVKMTMKLMRMDSLLARSTSIGATQAQTSFPDDGTISEEPTLPAITEQSSADAAPRQMRTGADLSSSQLDLQRAQATQSVQQPKPKPTPFTFTPSHLPIATKPSPSSPSTSHGAALATTGGLPTIHTNGFGLSFTPDTGPTGNWNTSVASASMPPATAAPPPVHTVAGWSTPHSFPPPLPQSHSQSRFPPQQQVSFFKSPATFFFDFAKLIRAL